MNGKGTETDRQHQQQEVDRNYEAFKKELPNLLRSDPGRTALMRGGVVVTCFDTERDAIEAGRTMFEDRRFSIQKIRSRPIDLGYFSRFGAPRRTAGDGAARPLKAGGNAPVADNLS